MQCSDLSSRQINDCLCCFQCLEICQVSILLPKLDYPYYFKNGGKLEISRPKMDDIFGNLSIFLIFGKANEMKALKPSKVTPDIFHFSPAFGDSNSAWGGGGAAGSNRPSPRPSPASTPTRAAQPTCQALYDFEAESPGELSFKEGDVINLKSKIDDNWYDGAIGGRSGMATTQMKFSLVCAPFRGGGCKGEPPNFIETAKTRVF